MLNILRPDMIIPEAASADRETFLFIIADRFAQHPKVGAHAKTIHQSLINRERLGSTGVGDGVAIPHAKLNGLEELAAVFVKCSEGVDFYAIDGRPVHLFFSLLVPENGTGSHLKALARVSRLFKQEGFRSSLHDETRAEKIFDIFQQEDETS